MKNFSFVLMALALILTSTLAQAKDNSSHKTYKEMDFIQLVNGKTREEVVKILGQPVKKTTPVMPTNAAQIVHENAQIVPTNKKDSIEMWHYKNLVSYNSKNTYKRTELTFFNNRCSNITYIN